MKILEKHLVTALVAFIFIVGGVSVAPGQTALFSYDDGNGTPNAGSYAPNTSFTFSITLAFTAGGSIANLEGVSYWFEQQNPSAPFNFAITLRNASGSQFSSLQTPGLTYPQNLAPQSTDDLGAALPGPTGIGNGSYFIANITVSISGTAAPGVYLIENTTTPGKRSIISDDVGHTFAIPAATYSITVVPEPSAICLLALGGLGATAVSFYRRRWRSINTS